MILCQRPFSRALCSCYTLLAGPGVLIIYPTAEFGLVRLSDAYSTDSSMIPQKKDLGSLEYEKRVAVPLITWHTKESH